MFSIQKILFLTLTFIASSFSYADRLGELPQLVPIEIKATYIPTGFDSNDKVQFITEAWLPSSCYRSGPYRVVVNKQSRTIVIRQFAYKYKNIPCLEVMTPFNTNVEVGLLERGDYSVNDGNVSRDIGQMKVKIAPTSQPDDFLYAPVTSVYLEGAEGSGARRAIIQGVFYNNCLSLKIVKAVRESYNVVTVLPVVEVVGGHSCRVGYFPFKAAVQLPSLTTGRYLLQVRSMNGQSQNQLFDVR
jgi:hypothetical protein